MKIAKDCGAKAKRAIKGKELLLIANAEPKDAEAHFGYSDGWSCRITLKGELLGESDHMFTITGALTQAVKHMLARPDGMTQAKAREFATWRDTEVEVR